MNDDLPAVLTNPHGRRTRLAHPLRHAVMIQDANYIVAVLEDASPAQMQFILRLAVVNEPETMKHVGILVLQLTRFQGFRIFALPFDLGWNPYRHCFLLQDGRFTVYEEADQ